ncbi:MAG: acyl-CoA dehydrogenase family protein [Myxococcota bacterium]|nr:acyl-CoA dehydrogenase family protein [Myxococcota bacterium]
MLFAAGDADVEGDPLRDAPERLQLRRELQRLIAAQSPPEHVSRLDQAGEFDRALHAELGALGVMAIGGPADLGGTGDVRDQVVAIEELAAGPTSMAAFTILQYMVIQVLAGFGSGPQRGVLRDLLAARVIVSFCMSEPDGGTDVARAMKTWAVPDGDSDGWRIRGQKTWITAATIADYLLVLARTREWERSPVDGVTMFLIPADSKGIERREIATYGLNAVPTCEVHFDDVRAPANSLVGEVDRGFRNTFDTLNRERLNAAAASLGGGRAALAWAIDYAKRRQAFERPIGAFQSIQHALVDGALGLESARGLIVRAAEVEAAGGDAGALSTMAKLAASQAATRATQDAMNVLAGLGFSREIPVQRWFRDIRLWTFAPASDEMCRNFLGERWLGLPRSY